MFVCAGKWILCVADGYAEWHPSCLKSPLSLSFSCRLFPLCILFILASCNCITILHSQYFLSLPSDCNTIHLQADTVAFSFYMQSISMKCLFNSWHSHSFKQAADTPDIQFPHCSQPASPLGKKRSSFLNTQHRHLDAKVGVAILILPLAPPAGKECHSSSFSFCCCCVCWWSFENLNCFH